MKAIKRNLSVMDKIERAKCKYLGHILRGNKLLSQILMETTKKTLDTQYQGLRKHEFRGTAQKHHNERSLAKDCVETAYCRCNIDGWIK